MAWIFSHLQVCLNTAYQGPETEYVLRKVCDIRINFRSDFVILSVNFWALELNLIW